MTPPNLFGARRSASGVTEETILHGSQDGVRTLLKVMVDQEARHGLTADSPPTYRIHGSTQPATAAAVHQHNWLALALMRASSGRIEERWR
jgi:hypothetical protein